MAGFKGSVGAVAAGAVGLAALLAGCGDVSTDGGVTGAQTKYITMADPICTEIRAGVGAKLGTDPDKEKAAIDAGLAKLKALPQPGDEQDKLKVFLVEVGNTRSSLQDVIQAKLVNNSPREATARARVDEANQRVRDAAERYGFEVCSQGLDTSA